MEPNLELERARGNAASHAWNSFISEFVKVKREVLFEAFQQIPINQPDELLEIKRTLTVLNALEIEINNIIDTGKMASKMIDEETEH